MTRFLVFLCLSVRWWQQEQVGCNGRTNIEIYFCLLGDEDNSMSAIRRCCCWFFCLYKVEIHKDTYINTYMTNVMHYFVNMNKILVCTSSSPAAMFLCYSASQMNEKVMYMITIIKSVQSPFSVPWFHVFIVVVIEKIWGQEGKEKNKYVDTTTLSFLLLVVILRRFSNLKKYNISTCSLHRFSVCAFFQRAIFA